MTGSPPFSDEELAAFALAAGGEDEHRAAAFDDDAVPFGQRDSEHSLLPAWYMPAPAGVSTRHRRRRTLVIGGLIAALVTVNGFGLCVTYGIPEVGDRVVPFR